MNLLYLFNYLFIYLFIHELIINIALIAYVSSTYPRKMTGIMHIVTLSVLDSNLFSIVLRVYNLTDFAKSQVSSVHLDFTYRTPPRLIKANKSPCYVLRYVNKHSFLLPQVGLSLIAKARPTSPFSLIKSWLSM